MFSMAEKLQNVTKRSLLIAVSVSAVVVAGTATLLASYAATAPVSGEPEAGTLSNGAVIVSDAAASGGRAIGFRTNYAVPAPTTADGFTQMFADKHDQTYSGGDQSTSFLAPNGRIYWLSGDTILSNGTAPDGSYPSTGTTMISNRILLQEGGQLVNAMANGGLGVPDPPTHTSQNGERYWPQGIFFANNKLYVLGQRVINTSSGSFDVIGSELATYSVASNGKLTFTGMKAIPGTNIKGGAGTAHIQWSGAGMVHNEYVYIYGVTLSSGNPYTFHFSYVARVPVAQVETPSAWQYYKKTTNQWVSSISELSTDATNQPDAILATQIGEIRHINGKFVIVHKPFNGIGKGVFAEIGDRPEGPFTQKHLFDSPEGTWQGKNYITYGPMLHPEQTLTGPDAGKILVSINWNGKDLFTDVMKNADLYKPRFYAFPLP